MVSKEETVKSEKVYQFFISKEGNVQEEHRIKESELEKHHKDLMLGQLIKDWDKTCMEVKLKFLVDYLKLDKMKITNIDVSDIGNLTISEFLEQFNYKKIYENHLNKINK